MNYKSLLNVVEVRTYSTAANFGWYQQVKWTWVWCLRFTSTVQMLWCLGV